MQAAPATITRWLWVWITIGALVVAVVIGFLQGIVTSLDSIDRGLREADAAVAGAEDDVDPLPAHVANINASLRRIEVALRPIPRQAGQIRGQLGSIRGTLVAVSGSLGDTSGSLRDTSGTLRHVSGSLSDTSGTLGGVSGSLVDTSQTLGAVAGSLIDSAGTLASVRGLAGAIDTTLHAAQDRRSLGTNAIWRRVRFANGGAYLRPGDGGDNDARLGGPRANAAGLQPIRGDADAILGGLQEVNKHLTSICEAPVLTVAVPGFVRPGGC